MEEENKQSVIDEYHRQIEMLLKQPGITADRILSYAKIRISANERLTFLASGVLTLTFSGAMTLYGRPGFHLSPGALRPLLWAWKLLIFAIICCIVANSREGRAASIHDTDLQRAEGWGRLVVLKVVGAKLMPDAARDIESAPKLTRTGEIHEQIAGVFGWAARLSTVVAFVLLYLFVRSLITQL
jgi:hypothetical protein